MHPPRPAALTTPGRLARLAFAMRWSMRGGRGLARLAAAGAVVSVLALTLAASGLLHAHLLASPDSQASCVSCLALASVAILAPVTETPRSEPLAPPGPVPTDPWIPRAAPADASRARAPPSS